MSVQASSWVIKNSKQKGSALLVMLMIANHAHSDGSNAFPGVKLLAEECRLSQRQITRIIAALEHTGELIVERSKGRVSHNYSIIMTPNPDKMSPANPDKMSESTLTNSTPNPDKSDTSTLTNSTFPIYKEEPSLEPSVTGGKTAAAAAAETSLTAADIFAAAFGVQLNNFARERIDLVTDLTAWRDFINERLMTDCDKPQHYRNAMPKWILKAFSEWKEQQTVPVYANIYEQIKANAPQQAIYEAERAARNAELKKRTVELMRSGQPNQTPNQTQNQAQNH